jgi:hypothetical protein
VRTHSHRAAASVTFCPKYVKACRGAATPISGVKKPPRGVKKAFGPPVEPADRRRPNSMQDTSTSPGRLRRWGARIIDGKNRWGFFRVQVDRFGVTRYQLVVYPPGISLEERRWLRLWRGLPLWGTALWAVLEICLQQMTSAGTALAISSAVVIGTGGLARTLAGEAQRRVRAAGVVTMAGHPDVATVTARGKLLAMADTLTDADDDLDGGAISPSRHEAIWWDVYDRLAPRRASFTHRSERSA